MNVNSKTTELRKQINRLRQLVDTADEIPYRDQSQLEKFLKEADMLVLAIYGSEHPLRTEIRNIRFSPKSFQAAEDDFWESWKKGIAAIKGYLIDTLNGLIKTAEKQNNIESSTKESENPQPKIQPGSKNDKQVLEEYLLELEFAPPLETINLDEMQHWEGAGQLDPSNLSNPSEEINAEKNILSPSQNSPATHLPADEKNSTQLHSHLEPSFKPFHNSQKMLTPKSKLEPLESASERFKKNALETKQNLLERDQTSQLQIQNPVLKPDKASLVPMAHNQADKIILVADYPSEIQKEVRKILEDQKLSVVLANFKTEEAKTLLPLFQDSPNLPFAVVVLDSGATQQTDISKSPAISNEPRASDFLHLGFLLGKLGTARVFVLLSGLFNFERPADIFELQYVAYNKNGQWSFELLRKLKNAGYTVDANKLL